MFGCGWLGTPLAETLLAQGHKVKGTTTSRGKLENLFAKGIDAFEISISEDRIEGDILDFLKDLGILIVNVPPKLRNPSSGNYVSKMELLLREIKNTKIKHLLFVSSTSVYGEIKGEITEEIIPLPKSTSGKQLLQAENLFLAEKDFSTTIIRFGGLIGSDRHPVHHLSGRKMKNGEELVNLIHLNDCIFMLQTIIDNGYWNEVFNGVYPYHPLKSIYYTSEAKKRGIPPPIFEDNDQEVIKKSIVFRNFYVKGHLLTTSISS